VAKIDDDLKDQINLLFIQLQNNSIDPHQFMKLLDMVYSDYLDFHPEARPDYYDRENIDRQF